MVKSLLKTQFWNTCIETAKPPSAYSQNRSFWTASKVDPPELQQKTFELRPEPLRKIHNSFQMEMMPF